MKETSGYPTKIVSWVAIIWVLLLLWYLSPLPYLLNWGMFNSSEIRFISLAFAVFIGLAHVPTIQEKQPKPINNWLLLWGTIGAISVSYQYFIYLDLNLMEASLEPLVLAMSVIGLISLIDAARRSVALPVALLAAGLVGYAAFGAGIGDYYWKADFERLISHYWLTSEGVFGLTLGVVISSVFIGLVIGAGLDRLRFGYQFLKILYAYVLGSNEDQQNGGFPNWLEGRVWTWTFGLLHWVFFRNWVRSIFGIR
ncbi:MAG: hypothetical protein HQ483_04890 [Rhodospirillales bacterium]|nr:hypothetical protein [Rhodospirillales bacterium]